MNYKQAIVMSLISTFMGMSLYGGKEIELKLSCPFFNSSNPASIKQWKSQPFYPFYTELDNATKIASRIAFANRINMSQKRLLEHRNYLQANAKKTEEFKNNWQAYLFSGIFTGEIRPWSNLENTNVTLRKGLKKVDEEIKTLEAVKQQKKAAYHRLNRHRRYLAPIIWGVSKLPSRPQACVRDIINNIYGNTFGRKYKDA
ncbi:hypothetical protein E3J79_01920 [Candidatus Dependentiae bacterium]|nr:MAG: hypothetical protein E3J79_01920 [Candidatus Dependentiae bacterium]